MQTTLSRSLIRRFAGSFMGSLGLILFPVPLGPFRSQLVGRVGRQGAIEFYSHPNFVCTSHLIWVGWLVAGTGLYNGHAARLGWLTVSQSLLSGLWLITLLATLVCLGLRFNRVACGFLAASVVIVLLAIAVVELGIHFPLSFTLASAIRRIPVSVDWGIPAVISSVLGVTFAAVAAWKRINDRWIIAAFGNYIEHMNFQYRDRSISKGAKTFVAVYDCLIRRYLLFGYGDIEVRSSIENRVLDRIEGVFFAAYHAEVVKRRFSTNDARIEDYEDEESEEEFGGVET